MAHHSAQPAGFFDKNNFMSPVIGGYGRHHAAGTAACDKHPALFLNGTDTVNDKSTISCFRINITVMMSRGFKPKAVAAAQAGPYIFLPSLICLSGKIGIRQ